MKPVDVLFPDAKKDRENHICPTCGLTINTDYQFRDALSEKEYKISGMCQNCQDSVFG